MNSAIDFDARTFAQVRDDTARSLAETFALLRPTKRFADALPSRRRRYHPGATGQAHPPAGR
ncbi:hypothetical protein [Haloarchaeobius amylolyticus]|uniref:hypothetical protein n=1 Tax=Haloarchaeobius amylolyticus TaxID=1198296 RepID=UPI00226E8745|nr:hypothetical protein [Haloarchaeobius amylolyticus]